MILEASIVSFEKWKQGAFWALSEAVKLTAVVIFLNTLRFLSLQSCPSPSFPLHDHFFILVEVPLLEEITFRGLLLPGIHLLQKGWNRFILKRELTEQEERIQRLFRIHLAAFVFAGVHYFDGIHGPLPKGILLGITLLPYLAGVLYGHLTEKFHTLSLSLLAHGIHNFLFRTLPFLPFLIAGVINKLFFVIFFGYFQTN